VLQHSGKSFNISQSYYQSWVIQNGFAIHVVKDFKAKENETVTENEIIVNQCSSQESMKKHSIAVNQESFYVGVESNLHARGL
jgi:hypothetical protein